jgi:hypothetical protein
MRIGTTDISAELNKVQHALDSLIAVGTYRTTPEAAEAEAALEAEQDTETIHLASEIAELRRQILFDELSIAQHSLSIIEATLRLNQPVWTVDLNRVIKTP